tara:strand:- start:3008 stop:3283 length:276 start_codon:yes stop_codon:yes gene_type:complete
MTLKKQSIRSNQTVTEVIGNEEKPLTKEELITRSEEWNDVQTNFFKKMLKQGGNFKVAGVKYKVEVKERNDVNSKGEKPVKVPPLPGERTF